MFIIANDEVGYNSFSRGNHMERYLHVVMNTI